MFTSWEYFLMEVVSSAENSRNILGALHATRRMKSRKVSCFKAELFLMQVYYFNFFFGCLP
jgi:hypothetical protein